AIPSHIDRPGSGLLDNLGILLPPEETGFDAIELSKGYYLAPVPIHHLELYPCVASSDAHYPEGIGCLVSVLDMEEKSWEGFCEAVKKKRVKVGMG
ncbi:MAG: PHP-associated domain-containing protein, partial [Brevinematales bacterium]